MFNLNSIGPHSLNESHGILFVKIEDKLGSCIMRHKEEAQITF